MVTEDETGQERGVAPYRLDSITISGFRSLLHLGPTRIDEALTVLTGQNDGGKTSFLDAIKCLLENSPPDDRDHSHTEESDEAGPIEISGGFISTEDDDDRLVLRLLRHPDGSRSRQRLDRVHRNFGAHPIDLPINPLRTALGDNGIDNPGGNSKDPLIEAADLWISTRPDEEFESVWVEFGGADAQRLPILQRFDSTSALDPIVHITQSVQREIYRLLRDQSYDEIDVVETDLDSKIEQHVERVKQ